MSRLATEYLQRSCQLPKQVESIEADLANGYLLVALLNGMGHVPEEEYEEVGDMPEPDVVLNNFRILARCLRKLDITLTRKDVANIVSETPGSSAQLVMEIRKKQEARLSGVKLNAPPKFKEVIKSARPKVFTRQAASTTTTTNGAAISEDDAFFTDARSVLDKGVFAELDMRCHLEYFYKTEFRNANKGHAQDAAVREAKAERRKDTHDATATQRITHRLANTQKDQGVTDRWIVTEEDKRKRQVRDLQFELATVKIDSLRRKKRSNGAKNEQVKGIDAFEVNLKRSGLGGGDDGGDLSTTYEDPELFGERLRSMAHKNWPSNDETSDFKNQLQKRTTENRVARYEKDRRRRRMLVEQAAANSALDATALQDLGDTAGNDLMLQTQALELKMTMKATKLQEAVEEGAKSREALLEAAEDRIREFSEPFVNRAEEIDAERRNALNKILSDRALFEKQRAKENKDIVKSIVKDFVDDIFDADSGSAAAVELDGSNPNILVGQLLDQAVARCTEGKPLQGVTQLDAWAAHAALGMNLGKWSRSLAPTPLTPEVEEVEAEAEVDSGQTVEEKGHAAEGEGEMEAAPVPEAAPVVVELSRKDSYLESAQTVLETIVQRSGTGSTTVPIQLSQEQQDLVCSGDKVKVVVALACGTSPTLQAWQQVSEYTGGTSCQWDAVSAALVGIKLKPLMEGKKPTVSFTHLVDIITEGKVECPKDVADTALTPAVLKTCNELVASAAKVLALKDGAESEAGLSATEANVSPVACAIAVGQSLWLRNFVREKLLAVEGIDRSLPKLVFASRLIGAACSFDAAVLSRVIDHFLQGGSKDDAPDTEPELTEAVVGEGGKAKAPAKKGKGEPEVIQPTVAIAAVAWVHSSTTEPFAAEVPELSKPAAQKIEGTEEDFVGAEQLKYYLDCSDCAKLRAECPANTMLSGETYLLRYGVPAVPDGVESPKPGDVVAQIPVYSLLNPEACAAPADPPVKPAEPVEGEEAVPVPVPVPQIHTHLEFTQDVSYTETVLSLVLDLCGATYGFTAPTVAVAETVMEGGTDDSPVDATAAADTEAGEAEAEVEAIGTVAVVSETCSRIAHIKQSRRAQLSPEDRVWLLHLTGENPLPLDNIFDIHGQICGARAVEVELKGLLCMILSYSMACIEDETRRQQTAFVRALKTTDPRWFDFCEEAMVALNSGSQDEDLVYEDLVCTLGNVIDDRHMHWLQGLTRMEDSSSSAMLDLQKVLLDVTELFVRASFEILEAQKSAAISLSGWLQSAGYASIPWVAEREAAAKSEGGGNSSPVLLLDAAVSQLNADCILSDSSSRDRVDAMWADVCNMELPSEEAVGAIEASSLAALHEEMVRSCHAVVSGASTFLSTSREALLLSLNNMKAGAKKRYSYEHEVLGDWGAQLRGYDNKPEAPMGRQFLAQFHFGVSDDVLNDKVAAMSGENQVEAGDFQVDLAALLAMAEELVLASGCGTDSASGAAITDKHMTAEAAVSDITCLAVKKVVQRGVQLPRAWRNLKRLNEFIGNFTTTASSSSAESGGASVAAGCHAALRAMLLALLHASVPVPPSVEYLLRLCKVLGKSGTGAAADLVVLEDASDPLTPEALVKRALADSKLAAGWAETHTLEFLKAYLTIVCSACTDCATGHVDIVAFILSLCSTPAIHRGAGVEDTLCFSGEANAVPENASPADAYFSLLSTGLYKAVSLAAKMDVDPAVSAATVEDGNNLQSPPTAQPPVVSSDGANSLDSLLGKSVTLAQLQWLSTVCGGATVVPSAATFRARISKTMSARVLEVGPEAEAVVADAGADAAEGGKEGAGDAAAATDDAPAEPDAASVEIEAPAPVAEEPSLITMTSSMIEAEPQLQFDGDGVWRAVDTLPANASLPLAMAWCLDTARQVGGVSFSISKRLNY